MEGSPVARFELMQDLQIRNQTKIVQLVLDGLGGLPQQEPGPQPVSYTHRTLPTTPYV
jgi:hypothetical protein